MALKPPTRTSRLGYFSGFWYASSSSPLLTTEIMISVVSRGELEDAYQNPEKYPNLLVRVGGFSAKFVNLEKDVQREVISRTLN